MKRRERLLLKLSAWLQKIDKRVNAAEESLRRARMLRLFPKGTVVRLHIQCEELGQVTADYERKEMEGAWLVADYDAEDDRFLVLRSDSDVRGTRVPLFCLTRVS